MTDAMVHRGPNDAGFYCGEGVGLAMRRLSIIDLATGHQPIASEDGQVQVVMNGEIYNFRELRAELERRGHVFSTATDTEVVVHLYEEHGDGCVEHLRGMFGLAVWDRRRRRLLLARDRLGIKPLYVARRPDALLFASELKAILALGETPVEIDFEALGHLFSFMTTPHERSIVAGIGKLRPAHRLTATPAGEVTTSRYWELRFEPDHRRSEGEWVEALRAAIDESVRLHRVADVPLGAFLSGGVDSSAVVASLATAARREGAEPPRTFSIGFREAEYNELDYARLVARTFGTRHREAVIEPEVLDELERLTWHLDEPFGDSSAIPTYMVSKLAAEEVTVVLSGDGGDELFAGYDRYVVERRERWARFLPSPVRALLGAAGRALPEGATGREMLRHLALTGADRYLDAALLFRDDARARLLTPEARARMAGYEPRSGLRASLGRDDGHWLSSLQRLDFENYLPLDILTKVDRTSMACSIESRVPLLDHPLVELAARIPAELKLRGGVGKHIFKRALEGRVPRAVLERPKRGFAIPLGRWFRGRLSDVVEDLLLSKASRERGIVRPAYVEDLLARHARGRPHDLELWTLISFELWCRTFLDAGVRTPGLLPADEAPAAAGGIGA
jgi:asparagine synthase (glutamine-hydrolysing)